MTLKNMVASACSVLLLPNGIYAQLFPQTSSIVTTAPPQIVTMINLAVPDRKPDNLLAKLEGLFAYYGNIYNVSPTLLRSIAFCESRLNPNAKNGKYEGLFQFAPTTWVANRKAMGMDIDPELRNNPEEAIRTASFKIARDGTSAWASCVR